MQIAKDLKAFLFHNVDKGELMAEKKNVISIDPDMYMKRMLHYQEKNSGWYVFRAIYIAIYLLILSGMLITLHYSTQLLLGIALVILALMIVVYGFVASLHTKLMQKYG